MAVSLHECHHFLLFGFFDVVALDERVLLGILRAFLLLLLEVFFRDFLSKG